VNVLDLFSGIGGFSLGLERAGMRTVAFCEIEPYARAVLAKHWPSVPCYDDVRTITYQRLKSDGIVPNVVCGGFPCQDISYAGAGAGLDGARSGLFYEVARIVGELHQAGQLQFVILENVAALLDRGLGEVLGALAEIGLDAEWHCIPASAVGALHARDRAWIIAYPERNRIQGRSIVAAAWKGKPRAEQFSGLLLPSLRDAVSAARIFRADHGVQSRVDVHRNRALGNTVYPQIPQIIGEAIMGRIADLRAWQDEADFTWTHTGPFGDVD
jgi:DNA (cytosine-5)-methyltransferase 1